MILKQIRVDTIKNIVTNVYVVCDNGEIMVIDPGGETNKIIEIIDSIDAIVKYIVLTHCHADHIAGALDVKNEKGGSVLISKIDSTGLNNPIRNLAPFVGVKIGKIEPDTQVEDGDLIKVGTLEFKVISTPGHTSGGICLYCEKENIIFTGDTIFEGTHGRTDLPTGSYKDMMFSIRNKLMILPEETVVYPGHGRPTTIGNEKNWYIENVF